MAVEIRMDIEDLRSLAFGSIGAAYAAVGDPLEYPCRILLIQNFTDGDLMISTNDSSDKFPMREDSGFLLDIAANKTIEAGYFFAKGTQFYVKEITAPTAGSLYLTSFYGSCE